MRRKFLCGLAASCWALSLRAQTVPARELWEFPLGAILQPAALAADPATGLWNPASSGLRAGERTRIGVTSMSTSSDQGVDGQILAIAFRRSETITLGASVARSAISGIVRTDSDPEAIGEVPYSSLLVSVSGTRQLLPNVRIGAALRWREGRIDQEARHAIAADLGVIIDEMPVRRSRLAISSFLWRPGREIEDRPAVVAALDGAVYSSGTIEYRVGYSYHGVNRGARESGPYVLVKLDRLEGNISVLSGEASGRRVERIRSGLALRYARYMVGVGREEGISGLGPLYQFTLSSIIR